MAAVVIANFSLAFWSAALLRRLWFPHLSSCRSLSNCCLRWRRAAFLIARRCAATASFSAWRCRRVRGSVACGRCLILADVRPLFALLVLRTGPLEILPPFVRDKKDRKCGKLKAD